MREQQELMEKIKGKTDLMSRRVHEIEFTMHKYQKAID